MGSGTCLRVFSGFMQIIFAICGIGLIVFGLFSGFLILISNSEEVMRQHFTIVPPAITIVLGGLLLIFIIVGCCGVCRESVCCMETYAAFLILLAISHLAMGIWCVVTYNSSEKNLMLRNKIEEGFTQMIHSYDETKRSQVDLTQSWMACCGSYDPSVEFSEYRSNNFLGSVGYSDNEAKELPASCCKNSRPCTFRSIDRFTNVCRDEVYKVTVGSLLILGWASVAVGATEFFAAMLGICLSCCIWRNRIGSWR